MGRFTHYMTDCALCGKQTTRKYARTHNGHCKECATGTPSVQRRPKHMASREEQHARYIDSGPTFWDDRDSAP